MLFKLIHKIFQIYPTANSLPKITKHYWMVFSMIKGNHGNSHGRCSIKKNGLKNFSKFTVKQLCQSLFLNKVAGLRPATLYLQNTSRRRILEQFTGRI